MLELKGLTKTYYSGTQATCAVQAVDLSVREGEFFSLLGPSGCGKTTLLRMLGGFEAPTSGQILQDGTRIDTVPANRRQFNMVFQRYALFPHLSVWENVAFGLRMKKVAAPELRTRVGEALALVRMEDYGDRSVDTLSGGQQQRIALARALVNRPRVLLLDEPLSALDLKLRQQMQVELLALQHKLKTTFIFVTHDQDEALTLSDRVAVMNGGVIEQIGSPREIYEHPRTLFVARFIGSMNSLAGEVSEAREAGARELRVSCGPGRSLSVRHSGGKAPPLPRVSAGMRVRVMIRPEKLRLSNLPPGEGQNAVEGTLVEILYQGPFTQLLVQTAHGAITVIEPNATAGSGSALRAGEAVHVAWLPEDCLLMEGDGA